MRECDLPKDEMRLRKYAELLSWSGNQTEKYKALIDMLDQMGKEGKLKQSSWTDGTGHVIVWLEFESMESFTKFWSNEDLHKR